MRAGGLAGIGLGVLLAFAPPAPAAAPSDSAASWIERMLAAQRLGDTLAARIHAHTVDYTKSKRDVVIELIRDARGPTMRTVVEVREPDPESKTRPVVFRIDSFPDGSLASWIWDIRFQRFVKMSGLEGTENFDGTHFHLEDLGFSGLSARKSGSVRELGEPAGAVELTSGAYHHYSRVETRIDGVTGLPLRTHIYDGTGARIWEIDFEEVETVGGRPLATRMRALNPVTRERSTLEWAQIAVGLRVPDELFDLEYLDAVIRRGGDPIELPEADPPAPPPSAGAEESPAQGG
jgi:Outer membrane lipoprotein-sorting protein